MYLYNLPPEAWKSLRTHGVKLLGAAALITIFVGEGLFGLAAFEHETGGVSKVFDELPAASTEEYMPAALTAYAGAVAGSTIFISRRRHRKTIEAGRRPEDVEMFARYERDLNEYLPAETAAAIEHQAQVIEVLLEKTPHDE